MRPAFLVGSTMTDILAGRCRRSVAAGALSDPYHSCTVLPPHRLRTLNFPRTTGRLIPHRRLRRGDAVADDVLTPRLYSYGDHYWWT